MASLEQDNLEVFYNLSASEMYSTISVHLKCGLIRGVVSLEEDNLEVFYSISVHLKFDLILRGVAFGGHVRVGLLYYTLLVLTKVRHDGQLHLLIGEVHDKEKSCLPFLLKQTLVMVLQMKGCI